VALAMLRVEAGWLLGGGGGQGQGAEGDVAQALVHVKAPCGWGEQAMTEL
jgi:hypothetical protein